MSKFNILGSLLAFALILSFGCSGDDDMEDINCGENWYASETVQNALTDYMNALNAYGMDPTPENCNAFKSAANDYIDILESFRSCAVDQGVLDEWEESFDQARDGIDEIEC